MLALLIAEADAIAGEAAMIAGEAKNIAADVAAIDQASGSGNDMMQKAQLFMVAGFLMLGWVLARRQLKMRKVNRANNRQGIQELEKIRSQKTSAIPLADAPPETQRWQAAMFDLQRELSADLDTRIATVQSLIRQLDDRIDTLSAVETEPSDHRERTSSLPLTGDDLRREVAQRLEKGESCPEIARSLAIPVGEIEWTATTLSAPSVSDGAQL